MEIDPEKATLGALEMRYSFKRGRYKDLDKVRIIEDVKHSKIELDISVRALRANQKHQIKRVIKCFKREEYERRYKVDLPTVIGVIVGEENTNRELLQYKRKIRI